ncbi:RNA polymerase ii nuclear localization protein slc7a6os-related [Anaeramoeba ignava]|uniref:Probable RNA polymerase II nuclear localization protein SLC7A6OS n=1 Tax=Anaeramoeba ignava TaxID=1746090 RepID=A0A9Q0L6L5_ANAIG|nr:RNA polymerase ii nuclear localization protein slc7a6os-related [Anaeramoeba ignava]
MRRRKLLRVKRKFDEKPPKSLIIEENKIILRNPKEIQIQNENEIEKEIQNENEKEIDKTNLKNKFKYKFMGTFDGTSNSIKKLRNKFQKKKNLRNKKYKNKTGLFNQKNLEFQKQEVIRQQERYRQIDFRRLSSFEKEFQTQYLKERKILEEKNFQSEDQIDLFDLEKIDSEQNELDIFDYYILSDLDLQGIQENNELNGGNFINAEVTLFEQEEIDFEKIESINDDSNDSNDENYYANDYPSEKENESDDNYYSGSSKDSDDFYDNHNYHHNSNSFSSDENEDMKKLKRDLKKWNIVDNQTYLDDSDNSSFED